MLKSKKLSVIEEFEEDLKASPAVVVADYTGLSVAQLATVRNELRELDATLRVTKNTLLRIAAERQGRTELAELLKGGSAVAFCHGDPAPVARKLADTARTTRILRLKGAVLDGRVFDDEGVRRIATLPPREQLLAQVVGGIAAPLSGFVNVLAAVPRGLVVALDQVRQQKEGASA